MKLALILFALVAVAYAPWQFALFVSIVAAFASPLAPLAAGLLADALYFAPHAYFFPFMTLLGAVLTLTALLAHNLVETRIMRA